MSNLNYTVTIRRSPPKSADNTYTGRAYIYFGGPSAGNFPSVVISGNDYSGFGAYVFKLGDVNGDGFSDVMVSTAELIGPAAQGFVYYGGSSMDTREDLVFSNGLVTSAFASSGCGLDFNGDGAADILVGAPGAGRISVYYSVAKNITVNLHLLIDGFYNSSANTQVRDTVRTYLRNAAAPYLIIDSAKAFLSNSGTASLTFTHAASGNYYLVVKHRNSIETWSKSGGISLIKGSYVNYDFTNTITKAFGSNMKAKGSRYSIYGGDSNQDGLVDLTDLTYVYNNASNFATGYVVADLNGDVIVDLTDVLLCFNNAAGFVQKLIPN